MTTTNLRKPIQDNRSALSEALQSMNPLLCFWIGLFVCAVVAYYVPLIIIALTGVWVNNLLMMIQLAVAVAFLVVQNLIGNRLRKTLLTGVAFALALVVYEAVSLINAPSWHVWQSNWMVFFLPIAACLLNALLFLRFKVAAGLK